MKFSFSYHSYQRAFQGAFHSAYGTWSTRKGFLIVVRDATKTLLGEVAPIPQFGTETLEEAEQFLQSVSVADHSSFKALGVPKDLPCCAFAISSINQQLEGTSASCEERGYSVAGLLPAGASMKAVFKEKAARGFTVFKWKIGVKPFEEESGLLADILDHHALPIQFRLDANASLTETTLIRWLEFCQSFKDQIEFFEQPMEVGSESVMDELSRKYAIPIALDESLNGLNGSKWLLPNAWRGPLVIKPCLLGSIEDQIKRYREITEQLVFSSAFETSVGLAQCLAIRSRLEANAFALGVDTRLAFDDRYAPSVSEPEISHLGLKKAVQLLVKNGV